MGALASSLYFARLLNQHMPPVYWVILACTVWLIYLVDHLADSYSLAETMVSPRRLFYRNNRKIVAILITLGFLFTIVLLFSAPIHILKFGIPGAILVGLYLLINQISIKFQKYYVPRELIISVLYLYGVCVLPIMQAGRISSEVYLYLASFLLLILGNVLIYTFYEVMEDEQSSVQTLSRVFQLEVLRKLNLFLLFLSGGIFSYLMISKQAPIKFSILGLIMAAGLFAIQYFTKFFTLYNGYANISDGLFLIPLILLLI